MMRTPCTEFFRNERLKILHVKLADLQHQPHVVLKDGTRYVSGRNSIRTGMIEQTSLHAGIVTDCVDDRLFKKYRLEKFGVGG